MSRLLKILGLIVGVVVLLLVVVAVAVTLLFDPNDYKDEITAAVQNATGRQLTLDGDLELAVFPTIRIAVGSAARITFSAANLKGECQNNSAPCFTNTDCPGSICERFCSGSFTDCTQDSQCPAGERCGRWTRLLLDNVTVLPAVAGG